MTELPNYPTGLQSRIYGTHHECLLCVAGKHQMHNGEEQYAQVQAAASDGAGIKAASQEQRASNHPDHQDLRMHRYKAACPQQKNTGHASLAGCTIIC